MTALRAKADERKAGARTREDITDALREYGRRYGPHFTQASFNPSTARWQDREDLVPIYYAGRLDGSPWPSLNGIKGVFGSFSAARVAAGFEPNRPGPSARRPAGEHRPVRNVRVERVYVQTDARRDADSAVRRAQERALAAERRAEVAVERMRRAEVAPVVREKIVKVADGRPEARLQARLDAEKTKRRETEKALRALTRERDRPVPAPEVPRDALAAQDALRAERETRRLAGRLETAEERVASLTREVEGLRSRLAILAEGAMEADLVRRAEARAEAADARADAAEREMTTMGAVVTGQARRLTAAEMESLRRSGPAGEVVLARALRRLARARAEGNGGLDLALMEIASAAVSWRDRLRP
jgi:hypothetical protein